MPNMEPERGFEPLACRLQIGCAAIAPLGREGVERLEGKPHIYTSTAIPEVATAAGCDRFS